jgi:hypothetical protein
LFVRLYNQHTGHTHWYEPNLLLSFFNDVHGGNGLAVGVLRVGNGVTDDILEQDLEHAACLLVDEPGDALDATPPGQPPDRRLNDALDVVAEDLPVALRATLATADMALLTTAATWTVAKKRGCRWRIWGFSYRNNKSLALLNSYWLQR